MRELHLFAGHGGGILGGLLLGHTCVCAVEIKPYRRAVLLQRQRDGILPWFPIWDDVRTFDGDEWRDRVDVVCGGFPCKDISSARSNNHQNGTIQGIRGASSGLWSEMRRIIKNVQPGIVFIENSPLLRTRGLGVVLRDIALLGFDAKWGVFGVRQFGADHIRNRLFILATHPDRAQRQGGSLSSGIHPQYANLVSSNWWQDQPGLERVANGVANQMVRLKAIGDGQIPAVVELAWKTLI